MTEPSFDPEANGWSRLEEPGYASLVGPLWERIEGDRALYALVMTPAHLNRNGTIHGGVILGLVDHALGHISGRATGGLKQATVQLDMQFVAAPRAGDFVVAHGTVVRRTRSLMFMRAEVMVGSRTIATASGMWKILGVR
jgi:uncharacterized protein (TIGR00369 family)